MEIDTSGKIEAIQREIEKGASGLTLKALLEKLYNDGVLDGITKTKIAGLPNIEPRHLEEPRKDPLAPTDIPGMIPGYPYPYGHWEVGTGDLPTQPYITWTTNTTSRT